VAAKDFRDQAVAASKRELGLSSPDAVMGSTHSACIDLPPRQRVDLSAGGRMVKLGLTFAVCAWGVALVAAGLIWHGGGREPWPMPGVGMIGAVVGSVLIGVGALAVAMTGEKRCARRIAGPGREFDVFPREMVGIEPSETYKKFKMMPDDLGWLYHDSVSRRLLIAGATHWYCLCAGDVVALEKGEGGVGGSGVRVDVRVGSAAVLSLVLSARKDLSDPDNPGLSYDPKMHFRRRLGRTLYGDDRRWDERDQRDESCPDEDDDYEDPDDEDDDEEEVDVSPQRGRT
jgi:hypothetical protein